jgi:4'-phosphopantetheinyl transferase EntD
MFSYPLTAEERNAVYSATEKRKQEFAAGRAAAREALRVLGCQDASIPVNPDRSPAWPRGFIGSITHCHRFCGAAAAIQKHISGIGFDAESSDAFSADILHIVCSEDEINQFPWSAPKANVSWSQVAFCAKEAVYKCYYPIAQTFLDFSDIEIRFRKTDGNESGDFFSVLSPDKNVGDGVFTGRWQISTGIIYAGVTFRAKPEK